MKLLALDAATEACSAALWLDGQVAERFEVIGRGHADRLLPMVDTLLRDAGLRLADCDALAFGRGPGGFTGLRIAAGVAQGLAGGAGLPVVAVSDLEALALAGSRQSGGTRVLACLDARMGQVYWAAYDCAGPVPASVTRESLAEPGDVAPPEAGTWFGAGPAFSAYPGIVTRLGARLSGHDATLLPRAGDIARIGALRLAAGGGTDAADAQPVYLRNEVVQRR